MVVGIIEAVSSYAWPTVAVYALWLFKRPIAEAIGRLRELGPKAIKLAETPTTQATTAETTSKSVLDNRPKEKWAQPYYDKLLGLIDEGLGQVPQEDRENQLRHGLAGGLGALHMERAYVSMLGSQWNALQMLADKGGTCSVQDMRQHYDRAASRNPDQYKDFTFERWFHYLKAFSLVERTDDTVTLTAEGTALIPHIISRGLPPRTQLLISNDL